jgi:hypothetical protein
MTSPINKYDNYFKEIEQKINILNPFILNDKKEEVKNNPLKILSKIKLINPYILSVSSFIVILLIVFTLKPKIIKKEGKVKILKLFLFSLVITIPLIIFFMFLNR